MNDEDWIHNLAETHGRAIAEFIMDPVEDVEEADVQLNRDLLDERNYVHVYVPGVLIPPEDIPEVDLEIISEGLLADLSARNNNPKPPNKEERCWARGNQLWTNQCRNLATTDVGLCQDCLEEIKGRLDD